MKNYFLFLMALYLSSNLFIIEKSEARDFTYQNAATPVSANFEGCEVDCGDGTCCSAGTVCAAATCCPIATPVFCGAGICAPTAGDCTSGCRLAEIMGEDSPQLKNLRNFRDRKLAQTVIGRRIILLYYNHAGTIGAALDGSPALRATTRRVLEVVAPMLGDN